MGRHEIKNWRLLSVRRTQDVGQVSSSTDPGYNKSGIVLYHGDCLDIMPQIEDGSIDAIIADLPYG